MDKRNHRSNKKDQQPSAITEIIEETSSPKSEEKVEELSLGLDISTSVIGVVLLNQAGSLVFMDHIKLTSTKFKSLWEKADFTKQYLQELAVKFPNIGRVFVEEAAKRFSAGFSSADTLFILAKFNGIVSYMSREIFKAKIIDVNVTSARSKLGIRIDRKDKSISTKEKVFQFIFSTHPEFPWVSHIATAGAHKGKTVYAEFNRDMCDAYVIVAAGRLMHV